MRAIIKPENVADLLKDSLVRGGFQRVLLSAENDSLTVTSTDLAAQLSVRVTAEVLEPGEICVDAATFASLSALHEPITLDAAGVQQLRARSGKSSLRLFAQDAADFPRLGRGDWSPVSFDGAATRSAIQTVAYAAAKDDVRAYLNCVHMHEGFADAANGVVIARSPCNYHGPELLLPVAYVPHVVRLLDEGTEAWVNELDSDARKIKLTAGSDKVFVAPLLPGKYPNITDYISRFIPDDFSLRVPAASVVEALTALRPFAANKKFPHVELQCDEDGARCVVDANRIDLQGAEFSGFCRAGLLINQMGPALGAMSSQNLTITTGKQVTSVIRIDESQCVHIFSQAVQ